ncbi:hypothetical protein G6F60_011124 [Rhizopus arrhizus]|nr:hypothetical protein G6F60_011124 [Rhizopus arrhizus]
MTQKKELILYGLAAALLAALGSGLAYYLVEDDRKVRRKKTAKRAERSTFGLLSGLEEETRRIRLEVDSVESSIQADCDDKTFEQKKDTLAQASELLLGLMAQADAVRPLTLIVGEKDLEATDFERELANQLKDKKRAVMDAIHELLHRLTVCDEKMKREAEKRKKAREEKARMEERRRREKEEEEEKSRRERELRRQREEEERLARDPTEIGNIEVFDEEEEARMARSIEEIEIENQVEVNRAYMVQAETELIELNED